MRSDLARAYATAAHSRAGRRVPPVVRYEPSRHPVSPASDYAPNGATSGYNSGSITINRPDRAFLYSALICKGAGTSAPHAPLFVARLDRDNQRLIICGRTSQSVGRIKTRPLASKVPQLLRNYVKIASSRSFLTSVALKFLSTRSSWSEMIIGPLQESSVTRPCDPLTSDASSGMTSIKARKPNLRIMRRLPIVNFGDDILGSRISSTESYPGFR